MKSRMSSSSSLKETNYFGRSGMKELKKNVHILSFFSVLIIYLAVFSIIGIEPFGDKTVMIGDSYDQYIPFYNILREKLISGSFLSVHDFSYSWSVGLGANFLLLFFYYLASPLNLALAFVPAEMISAAVTVLMMIKLALCGGAMAYFLTRREDYDISGGTALFLSLAYSFSGYICGYYWNVMWLDCLIIFPIVVLGLERLIKGRSPVLYIASLFLAIYLNFYIAFMICIFLVLYFIFYKHESVKAFLRKGITFAWSSLLSAGMSALSLLVIYFGIGHTMTFGSGMPSPGLFGNVLYSLRQAFFLSCPVTVDRTRFDGYANIYAGVAAFMLVFIFVLSDGIMLSDKLRRLGLIAVLLFSMNERVLNFIWHGFHTQFLIPNRFSFIFIFVILLTAADALHALRPSGLRRTIIATALAAAFAALVLIITAPESITSLTVLIAVNVILILIYGTMLIFKTKYPAKRSAIFKALICIMTIELIVNAFIDFKTNSTIRNVDNLNSLVSFVDDKGKEALERSEIIPKDLENADSYAGIMGADIFCSTARGDTVYTMMDLGYKSSYNRYKYYFSIPYSDSLLGISKIYYINGGIYEYDNPDALPIGFAVSSDVMGYVPDNDSNAAGNINQVSRLAAGIDGDIYKDVSGNVNYKAYSGTVHPSADKDNTVYMESGDDGGNILSLTYEAEESGDYLLLVRSTYSDYMTVKLNNEEIISGDNSIVNGAVPLTGLSEGDLLEIILYSQQDTPVMWFIDKLDSEACSKSLEKLSEYPLQISDFSEGDLSGNIDVPEDMTLLLTIPYDEGWTVYDNGEKTEVKAALRGFTAINLSKGTHDIRLVYTPEGFASGIIISALSWLIFGAYFAFCILHRSKLSAPEYNK